MNVNELLGLARPLMGKRVGVPVGLMLTLALGPGVAAQDPTPEPTPQPPPWFGDRVEMPELGFAVTLPRGWVAIDLTSDWARQLDVVLDAIGWDLRDLAMDTIEGVIAEGTQLALLEETMASSCGLVSVAVPPEPLAELADVIAGIARDDALTTEVSPPERVQLPAGAAFSVRHSAVIRPTSGTGTLPIAAEGTVYLIRQDPVLLAASCGGLERPADDWLSIVETIEFLRAEEPSPPPWFGGRVEMPDHGFAITLPDDWVAFDTSVDALRQLDVASDIIDLDPDAWFGDVAGFVDNMADLASRGMVLSSSDPIRDHVCGIHVFHLPDMPLEDVADWQYERFVEDPTRHDVDPPQRIDLPAGPAYEMHLSVRDPDVDVSWPWSTYMLSKDELVLVVGCTADDVRPEDSWLSIAETIEFLPDEE